MGFGPSQFSSCLQVARRSRLPEPTCRCPKRPSRWFFVGRSAIACFCCPVPTGSTTNHGRSESAPGLYPCRQAAPLPFGEAGNGRSCLGLLPLSGLQTSAYGCVQATMNRRMNRQPPDTASGSFPLVGLVGQVNGMNGTVCCRRSLVRACRPFSVFQGLTPSRSFRAHCLAGPTPCLRFLHLP